MSYDLAVWEGERPADDVAAGEVFERVFEQCTEVTPVPQPTPRIRAYLDALLERWPEDVEDEDDVDDVPWSVSPAGYGPLTYFCMVFSKAREMSAEAARMAEERGLVCYDPQWGRLRPAPEER